MITLTAITYSSSAEYATLFNPKLLPFSFQITCNSRGSTSVQALARGLRHATAWNKVQGGLTGEPCRQLCAKKSHSSHDFVIGTLIYVTRRGSRGMQMPLTFWTRDVLLHDRLCPWNYWNSFCLGTIENGEKKTPSQPKKKRPQPLDVPQETARRTQDRRTWTQIFTFHIIH
jgi:hypothetical protein